MSTSARKSGLTIVELMAAIAGSSILALAAGSMQRDSTVASRTLAATARAATNITWSGGSLTIQRAGSPPCAFSVSGKNLVFDPNTAAAGDQLNLVNGTLLTFAPTVVSNSLSVVLVLANGQYTASNSLFYGGAAAAVPRAGRTTRAPFSSWCWSFSCSSGYWVPACSTSDRPTARRRAKP